jgi:hypothetical protein
LTPSGAIEKLDPRRIDPRHHDTFNHVPWRIQLQARCAHDTILDQAVLNQTQRYDRAPGPIRFGAGANKAKRYIFVTTNKAWATSLALAHIAQHHLRHVAGQQRSCGLQLAQRLMRFIDAALTLDALHQHRHAPACQQAEHKQ